MVTKYGATEITAYMQELCAYASRMLRARLREIPDGRYVYTDVLDNDGISDEPIEIQVAIEIENDTAVVDFTGTAPQARGSVNAIYAITLSAVFYTFRCLAGADVPANAGCLEPIRVIAPEGTVVNAKFPAAVAGGNVETSQRIVDVLLGALAQACPDQIPAASSGTMNNLTIGGYDTARGKEFTYYETIAGGMGARPDRDGIDAIHTHMTNTMNTPIEAIETKLSDASSRLWDQTWDRRGRKIPRRRGCYPDTAAIDRRGSHHPFRTPNSRALRLARWRGGTIGT